MLNIGPDGTGKMDEEQVERLRQAGEWLSKYGETLYGLRGGPVIADRWGGTTYRDNIVYVHILEWEKDQITFEIPGNTMEKWKVISGGKAELTEENGTFSISVPIPERDSIDTILKLTFAEPIVWEGCKGRENDVYGLADGLKEE